MSVRVLVCDDSPFVRLAVRRALAADPRLEVIGEAADGVEAVERCLALGPDVVTMDVNMPGQDGIEAVRAIMARRPTPVVMLSAHTREGARRTIEALAAGAVDFVTKPSGEVSADLLRVAGELTGKLLLAAEARPRRPPAPAPIAPLARAGAGRVAIVGASTGGPEALTALLPALPADVPLALLVVQHLPAELTAALAERLDEASPIAVREARHGEPLEPGTALVAPGGLHAEVAPGGRIHLSAGPPVHGCRPAVDVAMRSAARQLGARAIGVVLTGMGKDGAEGLAAIRAAGGATVAQDQATSMVYGMPRAAAGAAQRVVALPDLPRVLIELAAG